MPTAATMLAAVMASRDRMEVRELPVPAIADGEVLVKMEVASICGSDVHVLFDGFCREDALGRPGYPGHEGVGEVVESRSPRFPPGTKVLTVPPGWYGGCFAQYLRVKDQWILALPQQADARRYVMAQQLGTTIFGLRKFWPGGAAQPGEQGASATVIGCGSAGLFFLQQLRRRGFDKVVVCDLEPSRLERASALGAVRAVLAPGESVVEATLEETDGLGSDLVIEAAGYDRTRELAVECVRKWGRLGFFGYPEHYGLAPFPLERAYRKAVTLDFIIDTSLEPGLRSYEEAVSAIGSGAVEVDYLTTARFSLASIVEALECARARSGGGVKMSIDLDRE